jgi:hypothetical protein
MRKFILSFIGSSGDQPGIDALQRIKISNLLRTDLERKLTKEELEKQIFKHIKNSSTPGIGMQLHRA